MKRQLKLVLTMWIASVLATHLCVAEKHELRSADGKTKILAEITRVTETHANIIRNGKSMKVDLKMFSEETRAMLKQWQKNNIAFDYSIVKSPKVVARPGGEGDVHRYGYELVVVNRGRTRVPAVKVRYQIYNTAAEMKSGEFEMEWMDPLDKLTFKTVAGSRTKFKRHWPWSGVWQNAGAIGNHLGGIWLRIYDKEGKMVQEWKSLNSKVRRPVWTLDE